MNIDSTTGAQAKESAPFRYEPLMGATQQVFEAVETLQKTMWLQVNAKITHPNHQKASDGLHVILERLHRSAWYLNLWAEGVYNTQIASINKSEIEEARALIAEGFEKTFELQTEYRDLTRPGEILHLSYALKQEFRDVVNTFETLVIYLNLVPSHE